MIFQDRTHSAALRIWHWLDGLIVTGLVATYFLRKGIGATSRFFVHRLGEAGVGVDAALAKKINHEWVDHLWTWHIYLGYALTAVLCFRIVLIFIDGRDPLRDLFSSIRALRSRAKWPALHVAGVRGLYFVFYCLQIFMIFTGFVLTFDDEIGLSRSLHKLAHASHEWVMWFFLVFTVIHIAGVAIAENSAEPGIVSGMIGGSIKRSRK